jgi:hypothetical protein
MAEPVVQQNKDGSYKLTWLLGNTYFADRLQELLGEVELKGNIWPLKSGQARLTCQYPHEKVLEVSFVCYLFQQHLAEIKQLNHTWFHSPEAESEP